MCQSLIKFSGKKLKVLIIESSDYSYGLERLTFLMDISDSAFDELTAAIASSQLTHLSFNCYLTIEKAKSLAGLLTQTTTLDEVSVGRCGGLFKYRFQCDTDVPKILSDAMKHSHVNKLNLRFYMECSQFLSNLEPRLTFDCDLF